MSIKVKTVIRCDHPGCGVSLHAELASNGWGFSSTDANAVMSAARWGPPVEPGTLINETRIYCPEHWNHE